MNGRLDVFAVYGPVMKRFPINRFSKESQPVIKKYLKMFRMEQVAKEKERLGLNSAEMKPSRSSSTQRIDHRLRFPPQLLVDEETVTKLWSELTNEDRQFCEDYCFLIAGRELQHVVTDAEIAKMIEEMNRKDLLNVLLNEKGNGAKVMMEEMDITEPADFQHNPHTVKELFKQLKTDFYGRFDFRDLQNVILEDRRVRLNAWVARILAIPVQKISLNKHLNPAATEKEKKNPSSLHYTINRLQPLPIISKKPNISYTPLDFPVSIIDKKKHMPNEEALVLTKLLHRHAYKFTPIEDPSAKPPASTVYLMKNINEGRNGTWNNFAGIKGNAVDSYVKFKSRFDKK